MVWGILSHGVPPKPHAFEDLLDAYDEDSAVHRQVGRVVRGSEKDMVRGVS